MTVHNPKVNDSPLDLLPSVERIYTIPMATPLAGNNWVYSIEKHHRQVYYTEVDNVAEKRAFIPGS